MPELPEVETVVRGLRKYCLNKQIKKIDVLYSKLITGDINKIINKTITDIYRRGKNIIFKFEKIYMTVHLRMEGKFFIKNHDEALAKHDHINFIFDDFDLRYNDTRKFGEIHIQDTDFVDVGVEATNITYDALRGNKPIKEILLDQHKIAGIGNIYADEICYYAKVMPNEVLKEDKYDLVIEGANKILNESIKCGGCTIRTYSYFGVEGTFQNHLMVHTLKYCKKCNTKIATTKVAGRTTYYCPKCQKNNIIIGLTGGIATGKSTVEKLLEKKGYNIIDTDLIVRDLWKDEKVLNDLKKLFNVKEISKEVVRNIIFNSEEERLKLNHYMHPLVKDIVLSRIKNGVNIIDAPLLFESKFDSICDFTICVYLDNEEAKCRLMERDNLTELEAIKRINSQMDIAKKRKLSTFSVDNSKGEAYRIKNLDEVLEKIGL
ncbi:MAG: DNA-formamidopyrimidine glycosylase [Acholeplasmatales bacterium]|nr:DNA-formamidopyrimidine glycosylase [Acholeplasmatales bacterium]